jgi:hypothetical protein
VQKSFFNKLFAFEKKGFFLSILSFMPHNLEVGHEAKTKKGTFEASLPIDVSRQKSNLAAKRHIFFFNVRGELSSSMAAKEKKKAFKLKKFFEFAKN